MKRLIILLLCFVVIAAIVFYLIANKKELDKRNSLPVDLNIPIPVNTTLIKEEVQVVELIKPGILIPYQEAKVLVPINGIVLRILFKPGDKVVEGQSLAIIDTKALEIDLAKAESNLAKLKRDLDIYTELFNGFATTDQKLSETRQLYTDALNQIRQLHKQISDGTVKAPIGGVMGLKEVEEGMFVTTGTSIGTISNQSVLKVKVNVTESQVYDIRPGQRIRLTADVQSNKPFWGTVTYISPQANETYNYQVEITANRNKANIIMHAGTFVYADFSKKTKEKILLIPREALNEHVQNSSVYIEEGGYARLVPIEVGSTFGNMVQVTYGLRAGMKVITSGHINLRDGAPIHVSKQQ